MDIDLLKMYYADDLTSKMEAVLLINFLRIQHCKLEHLFKFIPDAIEHTVDMEDAVIPDDINLIEDEVCGMGGESVLLGMIMRALGFKYTMSVEECGDELGLYCFDFFEELVMYATAMLSIPKHDSQLYHPELEDFRPSVPADVIYDTIMEMRCATVKERLDEIAEGRENEE